MKNLLLIILIISCIPSCQNVPIWQYGMFKHPPGNASYHPDYIKGWQDGCESGADVSSNYFYRLRHEFRQDPLMLNNSQYVNGWQNAYDHCRRYILQHNLNTLDLNSIDN